MKTHWQLLEMPQSEMEAYRLAVSDVRAEIGKLARKPTKKHPLTPYDEAWNAALTELLSRLRLQPGVPIRRT